MIGAHEDHVTITGETPCRDAHPRGRRHGSLARVYREGGLRDPYPYVACLVADGDRMGNAIREHCRDAEDHRRLSESLATFAKEARDVVERDHRGSLALRGFRDGVGSPRGYRGDTPR